MSLLPNHAPVTTVTPVPLPPNHAPVTTVTPRTMSLLPNHALSRLVQVGVTLCARDTWLGRSGMVCGVTVVTSA